MKAFSTSLNARRLPARLMEPVDGAAGWTPESLGDVEDWSYHLSDADRAELLGATESIRKNGVAAENVNRDNFRLDALAKVLGAVRRELADGLGIVTLRGFPLEHLDRLGQCIAYFGLGSYLGSPISQNMKGHILGHVTDLGGDYADPRTRGYTTRAELPFHTDPSDYVGLLCLQTAKNGGMSRVASSVTIYNRLLDAQPELVRELTGDFYRSRVGETNPGQEPWYKRPIILFTDGYFSANGSGSTISKAQKLPGVPPLTAAQKQALAMYNQMAEELAIDIPFKRGDVQFLNNHVCLHSRYHYEDWPDPARKRHLLRLWLSDPEGRPIPRNQRESYAGTGIVPVGVKLNVPLEATESAS
ncbi:MAG: TauD/TfdA family dioxygenase [Betaproteobacteria bacterium]|nr:TauD/TfdA family dioxygenase [Betaproteobacteria bacterium]